MQKIVAGKRNSLATQFRKIWKFRWLFLELIRAEIKLRYRQSFLGVAWTIMNPVLNATVLFFVFRAIFKMRSLGDVDFFPYVYSGVLLLNFITRAVVEGSEQLHNFSNVLRRVNIPAEVFVIAKVLGNLTNFIFGLIPLAIYYIFTAHTITESIIWLPLIMLSISLSVSAAAIFLSVLYVFFRDIQHLIPIAMNIIFYVSPVFYSVEMIGGNTQKIVRLNPIIGYLDSLRNSLNIDSRLNLSYLIIATVFGAIFLVASMRFIENNRMKAVFVS
jgi:ABC-type polysaccharide/polyol phosphate export permease